DYMRLSFSILLSWDIHPVLEIENLLSVGALFDPHLRILSSSSRHALSPLSRLNWRHVNTIKTHCKSNGYPMLCERSGRRLRNGIAGHRNRRYFAKVICLYLLLLEIGLVGASRAWFTGLHAGCTTLQFLTGFLDCVPRVAGMFF